jgi:hypothetical protein
MAAVALAPEIPARRVVEVLRRQKSVVLVASVVEMVVVVGFFGFFEPTVRLLVAVAVGLGLGLTVLDVGDGATVGASVGETLADAVGDTVGDTVGEAVGEVDAVAVGAGAGGGVIVDWAAWKSASAVSDAFGRNWSSIRP